MVHAQEGYHSSLRIFFLILRITEGVLLLLLHDLLVLEFLEGSLSVSELDSHGHLSVGLGESDVVVELGSEVVVEGLEVVRVAVVNIGDGDAGGLLESDELSEDALALDDAEWDILGSAEGREPADELDGVDVGGNDNELGLVVLNKGGNLVEAEFEHVWLLSLVVLSVNLVLGSLGESGLLLSLLLNRVVLEESVQVLS